MCTEVKIKMLVDFSKFVESPQMSGLETAMAIRTTSWNSQGWSQEGNVDSVFLCLSQSPSFFLPPTIGFGSQAVNLALHSVP